MRCLTRCSRRSCFPGQPAPKLLLAAYQVRLLQLDEALETLQGLDDNASASWRRLIAGVRAGEPIDLRAIPVPDPLDPAVAGAQHTDRPKASIVIAATSPDGLAAAVESALAQDYPDVQVVVAAAGFDAAAGPLAHLASVPRLVVEQVAGAASIGMLLNRGLRRCTGNVLGFLVPPDRLQAHHLDRLVAVMLAGNAAAAHGDRCPRRRGRRARARPRSREPRDGGASRSRPSCCPSRTAIAVGEFDEKADAAVALWLDRLARRGGVLHVPTVTVEARGAPARAPRCSTPRSRSSGSGRSTSTARWWRSTRRRPRSTGACRTSSSGSRSAARRHERAGTPSAPTCRSWS